MNEKIRHKQITLYFNKMSTFSLIFIIKMYEKKNDCIL